MMIQLPMKCLQCPKGLQPGRLVGCPVKDGDDVYLLVLSEWGAKRRRMASDHDLAQFCKRNNITTVDESCFETQMHLQTFLTDYLLSLPEITMQ